MKKIFLFLSFFFLIFLILIVYSDAFGTGEIEVENLGDFEKEKLVPDPEKKQKIDNITLVSLEGTPYEIGYQHGVLLRKEINGILDEAFDQYLPEGSLKSSLIRSFIFRLVKQVDKKIPNEYRQEIQGVADGANRSYDDILLINTFLDGFESINPLLLQGILETTGITQGCSSVVVRQGEKASNLIIGQTVDYSMSFGAGQSVVYRIEKTGKKIIYLPSFPGVILPLNGINEEGFVLTQRDTPTGNGKIGIPTGVIARIFLEETEDWEEARKYINEADWSISPSILIADSKNNLASFFEILPGEEIKEIEIKTASSGAANHYKDEEFLGIQKELIKKCQKLKPFCQYDQYADAFEGSLKREKFLEDFGVQENWVTTDKVIRSISDYTPGLSNSIGGKTVANEFTLQAVVFVPAMKEVYLANGQTPPVTQEGFVKIKLR